MIRKTNLEKSVTKLDNNIYNLSDENFNKENKYFEISESILLPNVSEFINNLNKAYDRIFYLNKELRKAVNKNHRIFDGSIRRIQIGEGTLVLCETLEDKDSPEFRIKKLLKSFSRETSNFLVRKEIVFQNTYELMDEEVNDIMMHTENINNLLGEE